MNTSPVNFNSAPAAQAPSAAGKQADSASQGKPFSEVLSREIAQNQRGGEASKQSNAESGANATPSSAESVDASSGDTAKPAQPEETQRDPAQAEVTLTPETLMALVAHSDRLKLEPASGGNAPGRLSRELGAQVQATLDGPNKRELGAQIQATLDGPKGRTPLLLQAKKLAEEAAMGLQKTELAPPGKAATAAFFGQLTAAKQADALKSGELLADLMSNPALRATPQAQIDAPSPLDAPASNKLAPSIGTIAWGQALGEKIVWMAAGAQQTASLTLNPPNMGPLQIVLNISNDQATASFFSAQPEVRQALEAAFPRLREMMNEAGIQLGEATVSADTPKQNDTPDRQAQRVASAFPGMEESSTPGVILQAPVATSGRGLVDTFA